MCKIQRQQHTSAILLDNSNEWFEKEIWKTITFTIASKQKRIKNEARRYKDCTVVETL